MKKNARILISALLVLALALSLLFVLITCIAVPIFTVQYLDRMDRSIFGYRIFIVLSDSMASSGIRAGDAVIVKEVEPSTLQPGDIITYQSVSPEMYGQIVTHAIQEKITTPDGQPAFRTCGTATEMPDPSPVTYGFILGKHQLTLPKMGYIFDSLKSTEGFLVYLTVLAVTFVSSLLCLCLSAILLILCLIRVLPRRKRALPADPPQSQPQGA